MFMVEANYLFGLHYKPVGHETEIIFNQGFLLDEALLEMSESDIKQLILDVSLEGCLSQRV